MLCAGWDILQKAHKVLTVSLIYISRLSDHG